MLFVFTPKITARLAPKARRCTPCGVMIYNSKRIGDIPTAGRMIYSLMADDIQCFALICYIQTRQRLAPKQRQSRPSPDRGGWVGKRWLTSEKRSNNQHSAWRSCGTLLHSTHNPRPAYAKVGACVTSSEETPLINGIPIKWRKTEFFNLDPFICRKEKARHPSTSLHQFLFHLRTVCLSNR